MKSLLYDDITYSAIGQELTKNDMAVTGSDRELTGGRVKVISEEVEK